MTDNLQQWAAAETYESVRLLIYQTVHKFAQGHGSWDFEEMLSTAHVAFMKAYYSHDEDKGAFTTWVYWSVWNALLRERRERTQEAEKGGAAGLQGGDPPDRPHTRFDLPEFMSSLGNMSDDARYIVYTVLTMPVDLEFVLEQRDTETCVTTPKEASKVRKAIRQFLRELGWTAVRIAESFREIKEYL